MFSFLMLALYGDGWSTQCPGRITPANSPNNDLQEAKWAT